VKRSIMIVIALAGILLAGKVGITTATNPGSDTLTKGGANAQFGPQGNLAQESTQAELERSQIGLSISPVQINAGFGRTRFLIGLGSYLVNAAGGCNDCHTNPPHAAGGDPFLGQPEKVNAANYLAGGTEFGPFTSRNLTPNPQRSNLPAGLTLEQFIHVMRTGEDIKQRHTQISPLLQVMPWPVYGKMSDRDLQAIYTYLSVIPPSGR
jgi:hypothetical protein